MLTKFLGSQLAVRIYTIFALGDYDSWNSFCKFNWSLPETAVLIDGQTAFGFTKPLSFDAFVQKNLEPWIEVKNDILGSNYTKKVILEIQFCIDTLFKNRKFPTLSDINIMYVANLESAGSVRGNKDFSTKKQYYASLG